MQKSTVRPNVAKASVIVFISVFLSRIVGMSRDTIMSGMFGSSALTDAYHSSFLIPDMFSYLLISGALSSAFIPVFSEYLHTGKEREAWKVFSTVTIILSIAMVILLSLTWIYIEPLAAFVVGAKGEDTKSLVIHMSRILLPAQFAFMLGGLMFGTLYARQQFAIPGLSFSIYNIGIIFGAICISQFISVGVVGMAWGALIGAYIGNVAIPLWAMVRSGSLFHWNINLRHPGTRKVFRLMAPVMFGLSLPYLYSMISTYLGNFYEEGIVTALNLSNKLMQLPLGIFGQSLALAMFPALSQFFAEKKMDLYRNQLVKTIQTVLYITIPISMIMFVMAPDVITAVLQYGKFRADNTRIVAECLQMFAFGISAWCVQPILMRGFYAIHNTYKPLILSTLSTILFFGLASGLGKTPLGYLSIPVAASITIILFSVVTFRVLHHNVKELDSRSILKTLGKCLFAALAAGLFLWLGSLLIPKGEGATRNLWAFIRLGVLGLSAGWIYYAITRRLHMEETQVIDRALQRLNRFKKRQPSHHSALKSTQEEHIKEEVSS